MDEFHWYTYQRDDILVSLGLQEVLGHSHQVSCQKANKVVHSHLDADNILKLSMCVRFTSSCSMSGIKASSIDIHGATVKITFGLSGDIVTRTGSIINVLTTSRQRDRVAVAVKAITPTDGGIRLLTSPSLANAVQNSSPLWSSTNTCTIKMSVLRIPHASYHQ